MDEITHARKCEIALQMFKEYQCEELGYILTDAKFTIWLTQQIEQEELLEIEKDVLQQQDSAREGR